jgi:uncharacterized membrane protein YraQ (UPF0718 family)
MASTKKRELEYVPSLSPILLLQLSKTFHAELLIVVIFFAAFTILLLVYQDQIVEALRPAAKWMHEYVLKLVQGLFVLRLIKISVPKVDGLYRSPSSSSCPFLL